MNSPRNVELPLMSNTQAVLENNFSTFSRAKNDVLKYENGFSNNNYTQLLLRSSYT